MPLNLITDPWIPAVRDNRLITIRPDQIVGAGVTRPDWPRADLNLACLEFLIGLVFLADPPRDDGDWHERYDSPDSERLRAAPPSLPTSSSPVTVLASCRISNVSRPAPKRPTSTLPTCSSSTVRVRALGKRTRT